MFQWGALSVGRQVPGYVVGLAIAYRDDGKGKSWDAVSQYHARVEKHEGGRYALVIKNLIAYP